MFLNHIKCSKCLSLAWTHAQRRANRPLRNRWHFVHTPKPHARQIFVRRWFSSSTSWLVNLISVTKMFPCMRPYQMKDILASNVTQEYTQQLSLFGKWWCCVRYVRILLLLLLCFSQSKSYTYNGRLIQSRIGLWSIEQRHFQWHWTTPNSDFKVTPFFDAEYLRNG